MKYLAETRCQALYLASLLTLVVLASTAMAQDNNTFIVERAEFTLAKDGLMPDAFVVVDVNSSKRHYFDDRKAAVQLIEVVYNYPMLDINNLSAIKKYYARVRFGIDTDELLPSLKSGSLWDNDWDLKGDWYEWEVKHPAS